MRLTFIVPAAVILSITLAACGSQVAQQRQEAPTSSTAPITSIVPGMIFDEQAGQQLLTAQDNAEGSLDYRLYHKDGQGQVRPVTLPDGNLLVIGAAFTPDHQGAYAILRFDTPRGSSDAVYGLSFVGEAPRELYRLENSEVSGTLLNSLRLQGSALQFKADYLAGQAGASHPENAVFQLKVGAGMSALSSQALTILPADSADMADYAQFLKTLKARDLAAQRVASQNVGAQAVTPYLSWPKASSGHHAAGSYLHGGTTSPDYYALDINRLSGDLDAGDDVLSARSGDVIQRSAYTTLGSYGNYLVIRHGNYTTTHYAHLSQMHVNQGNYVTTQQYIGDVGDTGLDRSKPNVYAHLHFAFRDSAGNSLPVASPTYPMYAKLSGGTCGVTDNMITTGSEYYRC